MSITAIWLKRIGDHAIVEVEVDGKFVQVIREHIDGAFSHIVEESGIKHAVEGTGQIACDHD